MVFICPLCRKEFDDAEEVAKHSLACWRENNPNHKSKAAPQSEDIVTKTVNAEILEFFGCKK